MYWWGMILLIASFEMPSYYDFAMNAQSAGVSAAQAIMTPRLVRFRPITIRLSQRSRQPAACYWELLPI